MSKNVISQITYIENGVSVTTQKHVTVTILGGVETVTREPHTTQKQVEYTSVTNGEGF